MVQVLPYIPSFGDKFLESFRQGMKNYESSYEKAKKSSLLDVINDPKATEVQKASAEDQYVRKYGKPADLIKLKEVRETSQLLQKYNTLQEGGQGQAGEQGQESPLQNVLKGPMYGPQEAQMTDQGQVNNQGQMTEQPPAGQIDQSAPNAQTLERPELNKAIAQISLKKPALGTVLQKQENQRQKNVLESEKQLGKSYEMSADYRSSVIQGDKAYQRQSMILDRILEIAEDPDIAESQPAFVTAMERLGIPVSIWGNPKQEELQKLSSELSKELPPSWTGRILEKEFTQLLATLPQLKNSVEGRKLIARNMKLLLAPGRLEYEEAEKLKGEYQKAGKKLPYDFQDQVYARMKPKMDELHKEFVKGSDEAIGLAARMSQGGTTQEAKTKSTEKKIQQESAKLKPVAEGKIRLTDGQGGFFDLPESAVPAAISANQHLKRVP
jgi:hypothetical protein